MDDDILKSPREGELERLRAEFNRALKLYNEAKKTNELLLCRKGLYHMIDRLTRITYMMKGDATLGSEETRKALPKAIEAYYKSYLELLGNHPKKKTIKYGGKDLAIVSANPEIQKWS